MGDTLSIKTLPTIKSVTCMKVQIDKIIDKLDISISGKEDWLKTIYSLFSCPNGSEQPKINGNISINRIEYDRFEVSLKLQFTPWVDCSRCSVPIQWPINKKLSALFRPETEQNNSKEYDLNIEELDYYFIENGQIDIELLLNEMVQMSLPTQLIRQNRNDECLVCGIDVGTKIIHESKKSNDESPFAALKKLNLKN
ncbi:MAG: hypothetical protein CMP10_12165 [Zetaproteobacteria bacterium]|nr:hypothetical protein [Pseudobdellovibrionaceae bacterium]